MLVLFVFLLAGAMAGFVVGYRRGRRLPQPEAPYVALEPPTAWAEDATYRRIVSNDRQTALSRGGSEGPGDHLDALRRYTIRYDGRPVMAVGIMEFRDEKVVRERIYFAEPFDARRWRSQWVERSGFGMIG